MEGFFMFNWGLFFRWGDFIFKGGGGISFGGVDLKKNVRWGVLPLQETLRRWNI